MRFIYETEKTYFKKPQNNLQICYNSMQKHKRWVKENQLNPVILICIINGPILTGKVDEKVFFVLLN